MADDRMAAAGVLQHLGADAAGEGAFGRGVAILAAERDTAAGERLADRRDQGRRRTHQQLANVSLPRPLGDAARQGETVGAQAIHLPVAGNKWLSLSHFHSPRSRSERRRRMVAAPPARLYTSRSTITPARPCCKRSAPERVLSSSRSCSGS